MGIEEKVVRNLLVYNACTVARDIVLCRLQTESSRYASDGNGRAWKEKGGGGYTRVYYFGVTMTTMVKRVRTR